MPKLKPHKQIKLNKRIVSDLLKAYDLTVRSFKVFPHGIENTTLLVKTNQGNYVLRVYQKNKKIIKNIEQEIAFMEFLSKAKISTPKVFKNIFGSQVSRYKNSAAVWSYILMEFARGKHPKSYSQSTIKDLATIQAKMHQLGSAFAKKLVTPKRFWKYLREKAFSPHIKISTIKNTAVKNFVKRAKKFEAMLPANLPQAYNHSDITHDNILVQNNRVTAVFDFDDASFSPSIVCLGSTLWDIWYITKDARNIFTYLAAYTKQRTLTKLELKTLKDVILFRNFVIGAMEIMFYGENGKGVKPILKFEEIINGLNFL
ncbi:MAG: hypothetical protein EXS55_01090 [Candidatus Magasanikbacteria bacterium]|nr:hypothetical protein [Candidatus Magasanikbacteria bacterium]